MKQDAKSENFYQLFRDTAVRFKNREIITFRCYYYQRILRSYRSPQNEKLFEFLYVCIVSSIFHLCDGMNVFNV